MVLPTALVALATLAGCYAGPKVGGREFPVLIDSTPQGLTAYFVPQMEWDKVASSGRDPLLDDELLNKFKVTSGKTPVSVDAPSYRFVVVVSDGHKRMRANGYTVPATTQSVKVDMED